MIEISKAAQQALEAMIYHVEQTRPIERTSQAIDALRAALQDKAGEVRQFRRVGCADWYDGNPDHEDGRGPYEARTLYAAQPAPVVPDGFALVPVSLLIEAEESVDDYLSGIGSGSHDRMVRENLQAAIAASQQKGGQHG